MTDLIKQLEEATECSRDLDADIAIDIAPEKGGEFFREDNGRFTFYPELGPKRISFAPKFTESIDAALTLVPEGWNWATNHNTTWVDRKKYLTTQELLTQGKTVNGVFSDCGTIALRLCIVSLKARHEQ